MKKELYGLVLLLLAGWLRADTKTEYMAIILDGHKIGHAVHTRQVENGKVRSSEEMTMTLGRGADAVTMYTCETSVETTEGRPLEFEMVLKASGMEQIRRGTIAPDGKITGTMEVMGTVQPLSGTFPRGALMTEGMRRLQEKHGLEPGTRYQAKVFRPDMLSAIDAKVEVGQPMQIDLFGQQTDAVQVRTTMTISGQPITITSYLDNELNVLKSVVPMMGMTLEILACDKEFALLETDVVDFLSRMCTASPVKLDHPNRAASIVYEVKPKEGSRLNFPQDDSQKVQPLENGCIQIKVSPASLPAEVPFPYKGNDPERLEALKPTEYLQSENPVIQEMAKHAVTGASDTAAALRQIESFVAGYITAKDFSVGYASALEVAKTRQGDCSEHAVLTAALCRAAGIPARVVCGLMYADSFGGMQHVFVGHAWTEAWIKDRWVGLDATRASASSQTARGFGPDHIALARGDGNPTDFFSMVQTFGNFTIEQITVTPEIAAVLSRAAEKTDENSGGYHGTL